MENFIFCAMKLIGIRSTKANGLSENSELRYPIFV